MCGHPRHFVLLVIMFSVGLARLPGTYLRSDKTNVRVRHKAPAEFKTMMRLLLVVLGKH